VFPFRVSVNENLGLWNEDLASSPFKLPQWLLDLDLGKMHEETGVTQGKKKRKVRFLH